MMSKRGKRPIGRIIAVFARLIRRPTALCTGRVLSRMRNKSVPRFRDRRIRRIIAARAGLVCFPARLRAGRRLPCVVDGIMPERRERRIRRIIAARAGLVCFPARLRTGRRLSRVLDNVMPELGDRRIRRIIAARAGLVRFPARLHTGCRLPRMLDDIMPECRDRLRLLVLASQARPHACSVARAGRLLLDHPFTVCMFVLFLIPVIRSARHIVAGRDNRRIIIKAIGIVITCSKAHHACRHQRRQCQNKKFLLFHHMPPNPS